MFEKVVKAKFPRQYDDIPGFQIGNTLYINLNFENLQEYDLLLNLHLYSVKLQ